MKKVDSVSRAGLKFWDVSKRLACTCLLFLYVGHVHAAWELVTKSPRGDAYYLDSVVVKKGIFSLVWGLVDLSEPVESSSSVKRLYQVDCVKGKLRVNERMAYAGKGGQGAITTQEKIPGQWIYPDPESINEELLLKICFDKKSDISKH